MSVRLPKKFPKEKKCKNAKNRIKLPYSAKKNATESLKPYMYFLLTLIEARLKDKRFKERSLPETSWLVVETVQD